MAETVRERLERLKNIPYDAPRERRGDTANQERKLLSPETMYMKKVEKVISTIEGLRAKMHSGTDQYLSLYYELKKAEADFLSLCNDPDQKYMDLPSVFLLKVENTKKKLLTNKI